MEDIVKQFLGAYYNIMMGNRSEALSMYNNNSLMSYNGENCQGLENIKKKIESFSFQTIKVNFQIYLTKSMTLKSLTLTL